MANQLNGPGWHLSLGNEDDYRPRKLTKREQAALDKQSAEQAKWIEDNWVPCVKCNEKHPPQHGSHCIVCAVHTPESEQFSHVKIGPRKP